MPNIIGTAAAGFQDASMWETAKKKDNVIKIMINKALENTSVTVVCVTYGSINRKYINYEIDQSLKRGNGLVGLQIHHLKDQNGNKGLVGRIPSKIKANGYKEYKYTTKEQLAKWIEQAAKKASEKKTAARLAGIFKLKRRRP